MKHRSRKIIIIFLLLIAGTLWYKFSGNKPSEQPVVEQPTEQPATPTLPQPDTTKLLAQADLPKLASGYYHPLAESELTVPSDASLFQADYNAGAYKELAVRPEEDLMLKGGSFQLSTLNFFSLYQALSHLHLNQNKIAAQMLAGLSHRTPKQRAIRQQADWYLLIAYLRMNEKSAAIKLSAAIAKDTANPHSKQAREILDKIKD